MIPAVRGKITRDAELFSLDLVRGRLSLSLPVQVDMPDDGTRNQRFARAREG